MFGHDSRVALAKTSAIEFHPAAAEEADAAVEWYAERSSAVARGFLNELALCVDRVQDSPSRWPIEYNAIRRYVFPRYPFVLFYRQKVDVIQVVAVAHQSRRPRYWASR